MMRLSSPTLSDAGEWVRRLLGDLAAGQWRRAPVVGGQGAADAALASFDVSGYAVNRNEVWPLERRGSSRLSPYIRHGLLSLRRVWDAVDGGPSRDVEKFRDELLWQEYSRHLYARLGGATRASLRFVVPERGAAGNPWGGSEACVTVAWEELQGNGWVTNQQRMWLASHWSVRHGQGWRESEDLFFRHLLDGSRAANRVGWQWTVGALTGKPYGFSRWQVEKRAPGLCRSCAVVDACPIEDWPAGDPPAALPDVDPLLRRDPDPGATGGPTEPVRRGDAEAVWITAESLGDEDPALHALPSLPAVFVFDESLLRGLQLSPARLVFLAECLADLAERRQVEVWRGDPVQVLTGRRLAATFTPVPGWRQRAARLNVVDLRPWPWLRAPHGGSVTSFTAWNRTAGTSKRPRGRG